MAGATDVGVAPPDGKVVVVGEVVVVVEAGSIAQTAYSVRPFAGMVMACDFEYDTPLPVLEVSHRDSKKLVRVNAEPLLNVTLAPDAA